jgi:hypothetical protein
MHAPSHTPPFPAYSHRIASCGLLVGPAWCGVCRRGGIFAGVPCLGPCGGRAVGHFDRVTAGHLTTLEVLRKRPLSRSGCLAVSRPVCKRWNYIFVVLNEHLAPCWILHFFPFYLCERATWVRSCANVGQALIRCFLLSPCCLFFCAWHMARRKMLHCIAPHSSRRVILAYAYAYALQILRAFFHRSVAMYKRASDAHIHISDSIFFIHLSRQREATLTCMCVQVAIASSPHLVGQT